MRSLDAAPPLDEIPLSPQTSRSFEIGLKSATADRSFSYSLAAYDTLFHGYQANFNDTVGGAQVTRLISAGTVRSRGVEADGTVRPTVGFTMDASVAYTDATVRHFNCPVGSPSSCDIDGKVLPFAPKVKIYRATFVCGGGRGRGAVTSCSSWPTIIATTRWGS
jgi:iron complex outermembrane receptor protein